jgi:hypothetical protein
LEDFLGVATVAEHEVAHIVPAILIYVVDIDAALIWVVGY